MAFLHGVPLDLAVLDQQAGGTLDEVTEAVRAERDRRHRPMQPDQDQPGQDGLEDLGHAVDRPADHRTEDDRQDQVEGGVLAHEAFLAETYQQQRRSIHDHRADHHLVPVQVFG
jgi:hypothetical protein